MGSDPSGALRLAEQHRSRFPRGTLAQEREVIAIDALVRQGRTTEAQGRAERFRMLYPRSSHLDRLPILRDNRD
jgi:outer membrane protein assembly factor BamD (BamD/ComL family)